MEKKQSDDYLTGKKTIDLDKEEKNQLQDLESKAVAGSMFLDGEDDVTNVLNWKIESCIAERDSSSHCRRPVDANP